MHPSQFDFGLSKYPVERILSIGNHLGESPVWSSTEQALYWVDILEGTLFKYCLVNAELLRWEFDFTIGCIGLCKDGRIVMATGAGVQIFCPITEVLEFISHPEVQIIGNRFNDGKVSPDGRFWFGSMDDRPEKGLTGSLYCLDASLGIKNWGSALRVSNGLAWSPAGDFMYHSCSRSGVVFRYSYSLIDGEIGPREIFIEMREEWGRPDGAAVDIDGRYWICGAGKGRINCFSSDGNYLGHFETPTPHPTMPCFGGADLKTLFFTSSREGYTAEMLIMHPGAGDLYQVPMPTPGVPVGKFALSLGGA
jgi:sugar lactone lactonase YvrE